MENCRVNKITREVNTDLMIQSIELIFKYRSPATPQQAIEIYNKHTKLNFGDKLQLAHKWQEIINAAI